MTKTNRLTALLGVKKPIIAGGMVWCSGWRLAAAVSNAGGLGLIGAGSMHPEILQEHIQKCKQATDRPFGVNVPLLYPEMDRVMQIIMDEKVPIVVTSAGNPKTWTAQLHEAGCKVLHVVSSAKFAQKAEAAGVDAIIAEGFEAGGHNGREETTTMCLIPSVVDAVSIPVVAAGGIASGRAIAAAQCLGAEGVQIGTLFALSEESSAHEAFKLACCAAGEGDTALVLKKLAPTRLLKKGFWQQVVTAEDRGANADELNELLGKGRAKKGIFEGDLEEGEPEIGQVAAQIDRIRPIAEIMQMLEEEYHKVVS
ncbi:MAG: nitronate monooxygenase [Bacteroidales bacterium]|nr:nitronate monooxygenase [Porphyromonas sp.]MDD6934954.1 nitronate monooxygenase [Bacteroidales bacterium]MDY3102467.1 nitronate monooxygenase [Porphyromonas sp.]